MPVISMFYGIVILMYYFDDKKHHKPHIPAQYQDDEAVIAIPEGDVLEGSLPRAKLRLVQAWIEIHRDDHGELEACRERGAGLQDRPSQVGGTRESKSH